MKTGQITWATAVQYLAIVARREDLGARRCAKCQPPPDARKIRRAAAGPATTAALLRFRLRRAVRVALLAWLFGAMSWLGTSGHVAGAVAPTNREFAKWEKEISAFEAADRTNPPPTNAILFIGSSSIRMWRTLVSDFPEHRVFNRGFGGSQIIDSVHFAERIVLPYRPKQIVLYVGGNDINAGKTPEQVFEDFTAFVRKVHRALPQTRIAYISIAPNPARWAQVDRIRRANQLIRDFTATDARLDFIDVFPHMLGDDGQPRPELFVADRLHMNERGYALWRRLVESHLVPGR